MVFMGNTVALAKEMSDHNTKEPVFKPSNDLGVLVEGSESSYIDESGYIITTVLEEYKPRLMNRSASGDYKTIRAVKTVKSPNNATAVLNITLDADFYREMSDHGYVVRSDRYYLSYDVLDSYWVVDYEETDMNYKCVDNTSNPYCKITTEYMITLFDPIEPDVIKNYTLSVGCNSSPW